MLPLLYRAEPSEEDRLPFNLITRGFDKVVNYAQAV